jgi:hypothetical protein
MLKVAQYATNDIKFELDFQKLAWKKFNFCKKLVLGQNDLRRRGRNGKNLVILQGYLP